MFDTNGSIREERGTYNILESPDFLLLGDYTTTPTAASPSTIGAILAPHYSFHDFAQKSYTFSVSKNGAIWVIIGGVQLYSLTSQFKCLSQSTFG